MEQVKCTILSVDTKEVPTKNNYPIQTKLMILVTKDDGSTMIVPKIIHEPLWYSHKYRLQIFSRKQKTIVPMKEMFDTVDSLDSGKRFMDTINLSSLVLGLVHYGDTHTKVVQPKSGLSFNAFLAEYKGVPVITRYHFTGERNEELFPEPFNMWFDHEAVEDYVSQFAHL